MSPASVEVARAPGGPDQRAEPESRDRRFWRARDTPAAIPPPPARRWRGLDVAVVVAVVVATSLPYLLGALSPGVMGFNSGLAEIPLGPWLGLHLGLPWIDPNVGFVSQSLGHLAATDLLHGHVPWWNPFEGVGTPLVGEGQSAGLFPFTVLLALAHGQVLFHLVLQVVAAIATLGLLTEMGFSRPASLAGAIAFGCNGTFAWLTNAAFNPVAFLPVLLWGIERCRRVSPAKGPSGWLLVAAGVALSIYAGFPETAFIGGLLAILWALVRLAGQPAGRRLAYGAGLAVGGGVGLALSAPFLVAFKAATAHADIGGHAGAFATAHLPGAAASTLGLPYLFGPIEAFSSGPLSPLGQIWGNVGGYATAALVVAAFGGLVLGRQRALNGLLALWIALTLAKSFGAPVVAHLLNGVPGVGLTAFYRYAPPSWEIALVLLAAAGIDALGAPRAPRAPRVRAGVAVAGIAGMVALGAELLAARPILLAGATIPDFSAYASSAIVWALLSALLAVAVGLLAPPRAAAMGIAVLLSIDAVAMFMVPQLSAPGQPIPLDTRPVTYLQHHLGLARFATLGPIVPNYGSYFQIAEVNAHDLPLPGAWARYVAGHLETNELPQQFDGVTSVNATGPSPIQELERNVGAYEAIGVKYVVAPALISGLPGRVVFTDHFFRIWQLPHPAPFYQVTSGHCRLTDQSTDALRATCATPSTVVRAELDLPGWTATVGTTPVPLEASGPLFGAIHLPQGTSVVHFAYRPPHLEAATFAAAAGVLGAIAALALPLALAARRRRSPPDRPTAPRAPGGPPPEPPAPPEGFARSAPASQPGGLPG